MTANCLKEPNTAHQTYNTLPINQQRSRDDFSILDEDGSMPIAIIGIGFRGPGDAVDVESLWTMICEGREAWSEIPKARWHNSAFYHPDHSRHGTINVNGGHFLREDISLFDAPFFNMTSDEAAAMDPQQRLLLEVTYEGLENAGISLSTIMGSQTSCFVGSFNADYTDLLLRDPDCVPMYQCTNAGQSRAMIANRISYFYDLKGPSVTVDTACSGSLVALHLACQSLRTGDSSMAIAAGVNIILSHEFMSTMTMMKFLSLDGRCRTFDENADGYARGEGIGCLILKPLRDALKHHDPIRAIIRGSGSNQDGRTSGITLPNGLSQEALIRHVYNTAGVDPRETAFVETHGTGTQAGDPIESGALARVFGPGRSSQNPLRIGSIKTNVGHLEGTSGIAGVIKATLMLERRTFLPNRNFKTLNPRILAKEWNLQVQLARDYWDTNSSRRISVNSFGYGGSNAHIILEDTLGYLSQRKLSRKFLPLESGIGCRHASRSRIFMLSAFDEFTILKQIQRLLAFLQQKQPIPEDKWMADLAFTLNERRTTHLYRTAIHARTINQMMSGLSARPQIFKAPKRPKIGFIFTGQGAQWPSMGKELLEVYPIFKASILRIETYLSQIGATFRIIDEILKPEDDSLLRHPLRSQPICSALQIALVDLLESWGIYPDSVTGHSSGEIAAAYAAKILSMQDAMAIAYFRGLAVSKLLENRILPKGAMLAVGMSADDVEPYIQNLQSGRATVACINSPSSITVSGDVAAVEELELMMSVKQVFSRRLAVEVAYHSHHMELVGGEYLDSIAHIKAQFRNPSDSNCPQVPFFSSVTGHETCSSDLGPGYWVRNLLGQVRFLESTRALCFRTGAPRSKRSGATGKATVDCLLEIGPHSALAGPVKQILKADSRLDAAGINYVSVLIKNKNAIETSLTAAAFLACTGYPISFHEINDPSHEAQVLHDLPPYGWNHTRSYWSESRVSKSFRNRKFPRTDLLGVTDHYSCPLEPRWRNFIRLSEIPWLKDHKIESNIIYPAAGYIAMAIEATVQNLLERKITYQDFAFHLRDVSILSALVIQESSPIEIMISFHRCTNIGDASSESHMFTVYSVTPENRWTEHCSGYIGVQSLGPNPLHTIENPYQNTLSRSSSINVQRFYENLASIGLEYGKYFANITQACVVGDICLAEITAPNTAAAMPMTFQYPHIIHPCTLDSIIQTIFVRDGSPKAPAIPVYIEEMIVASNFPSEPGRKLETCTKLISRNTMEVTSTINAASNCSPVLSITALRCRYIERGPTEEFNHKNERIAYSLRWKPDPDLLTNISLSDFLAMNSNHHRPDIDLTEVYESYALHFIRKAANNLLNAGTEYLPQDGRRLLNMLIKIADVDLVAPSSSTFDIRPASIELPHRSTPQGRVLCAIGERLPQRLVSGQSIPMLLAESQLWVQYCESLHENVIYSSIVLYLQLMCHKNPMITILEVESGEGNPSSLFLNSLTHTRFGRYTITHPNPKAFHTTNHNLFTWGDLVEFKTLNIEDNLEMQAFSQNSYDIVLVPYGLYTVKSVTNTLRNIHSLLRPGGDLIIIDPTPPGQKLTNAIFLSSFSEERLNMTRYGKSGLLKTLDEFRFSKSKAMIQSDEGCSIITSKLQSKPSKSQAPCLIIAEDDCNVCIHSLQTLLQSSKLSVEVGPFENAQVNGKACIVLSDLTSPVLPGLDGKSMQVLKEIFRSTAGVLWVTRGGTISCHSPNNSLITGFARTARSESGVSPILTLDLDARHPLHSKRAAEVIYDVFRCRILEPSSNISDTEFAERRGIIQIPRVVEDIDSNKLINSLDEFFVTNQEPFHQGNTPFCATFNQVNKTFKVQFEEEDDNNKNLPPDHIDIQVHAIGFNKSTAARLPNSYSFFGSGWSGVVKSVGSSVSGFIPGDMVACLELGKVTNIYRAASVAFQTVATKMSFEEAATLPQIYCLAFYVVHHLARINRQNRVLIHSAASMIGLAVTEICHLAHAHLLAVVDSSEEKDILTKSLSIPEENVLINKKIDLVGDARKLMNDQGVDVLINCLAQGGREFQQLWQLVGACGQFIQLSSSGTSGVTCWEVPNLQTGVSFITFGVEALWEIDSVLRHKIWSDVNDLFLEKKILGSLSVPQYKISELSKAMENLIFEESTEFLTVTAGSGERVEIIHPKGPETLLREDVSYVLVGGLGGIGRATALWMADHGAKTLIFMNRSGLSRESSIATAHELENRGVRVIVRSLDITNTQNAADVMAELAQTAPPIRGIIQAAMVLRDTHIEKLTVEDYHSVLQPKFQGTWNLHNHAPKNLDWFIMLSSISGIIGNATQAAYAAGSTFLDAFAAYRNSLGLQAVSLDLGVITDAGYLAENPSLARKMAQQGFQGTDTKRLMSLIELAMRTPPPSATTTSTSPPNIITGLGAWNEAHSLPNFDAPIFSHFRRLFQNHPIDTNSQTSSSSLSLFNTLREDLKSARTLDEASTIAYNALSAKIAAHLNIAAESIVPNNPITDYGIDSHVAIDLRNWISQSMESVVPILDILATGSLIELAEKIVSKSTLVEVKGEDE